MSLEVTNTNEDHKIFITELDKLSTIMREDPSNDDISDISSLYNMNQLLKQWERNLYLGY